MQGLPLTVKVERKNTWLQGLPLAGVFKKEKKGKEGNRQLQGLPLTALFVEKLRREVQFWQRSDFCGQLRSSFDGRQCSFGG
ncbi:MAG: hypothetical protein GY820_33445 [Gammaproteobacteria bacterium]|nr:hypothetical protein [Gammaproteobacteria bacterium]